MENLTDTLTTTEAVKERLWELGAANGAWANINTRHAAYTGLQIPVDGWTYEEVIAETAAMLFEVDPEDLADEQLGLVIHAYEEMALDADLYDAHLLQEVFEEADIEFDEFIEYCQKAGLEPEVIEEFSEL
jgi:hypothetical protein